LLSTDGIEKDIRVATEIETIQGPINGYRSGYSRITKAIHERDDYVHYMRARTAEFSDKLMILRLPRFWYTEHEVDAQIARARKHQALILDLRGNPGGKCRYDEAVVERSFRS